MKGMLKETNGGALVTTHLTAGSYGFTPRSATSCTEFAGTFHVCMSFLYAQRLFCIPKTSVFMSLEIVLFSVCQQ